MAKRLVLNMENTFIDHPDDITTCNYWIKKLIEWNINELISYTRHKYIWHDTDKIHPKNPKYIQNTNRHEMTYTGVGVILEESKR